jgi:hypothetical protein
MTETTDTVTVTCEGGPLDGTTFDVTPGVRALNALAIKAADGKWVDPRTWANSHGFAIAEGEPPQTWPPQVREQIVAVEYLIDTDHATAAFREPAIIREQTEGEPEREWVPADPRQSQQPRWIAWKTVATALGPVVGGHPAPDECGHVGKCATYAAHVARLAVDAILDDGLRIVEPTRVDRAAVTVARLFHDTYQRLAPDFDLRVPEETQTLWEALPDNWRALMTETARQVLGSLDMQGRVVVLHISEAAAVDASEFDGLGNLLRAEAGAALMLALPDNLGITIETLDEQEMREAGWQRVPPPPPVEPVEFADGPLDLAVVTSCPTCGESFVVEVGHHPERRIAAPASRELGAALHEHLNAEHPEIEHGEVKVELVDTHGLGVGERSDG